MIEGGLMLLCGLAAMLMEFHFLEDAVSAPEKETTRKAVIHSTTSVSA
jgi:hypothetical protein